MNNISERIARSGGAPYVPYRAMLKWLTFHVASEASFAHRDQRESNYQVMLFGTGSLAWDHYQSLPYVEKHDPELYHCIWRVMQAENKKRTAMLALDAFIRHARYGYKLL